MLKQIIQAPMAGLTTPAFVAAVCKAGALGSLGAGYMHREELREGIRKIRRQTQEPFNVNLFIPSSEPRWDDRLMRGFLNSFWEEMGAYQPQEEVKLPVFEEQIEVLLEEKIPIFSFTFGIPSEEVIKAFKQQKTYLIGTATSRLEAEKLAEKEIDAIVCQGLEAGGHRGSFLEDSSLGVLELVEQILDRVKLPLIASGGIMTREDICSALKAGASSVQIGTAFITTEECEAPIPYKKALLHSEEIPTFLTRAFSGKYARAVVNRLMMSIEGSEIEIPPYPQQHQLTRALRVRATELGHPDLMSLYAGMGASHCRCWKVEELLQSLT